MTKEKTMKKAIAAFGYLIKQKIPINWLLRFISLDFLLMVSCAKTLDIQKKE
jgi:hypothetical protein